MKFPVLLFAIALLVAACESPREKEHEREWHDSIRRVAVQKTENLVDSISKGVWFDTTNNATAPIKVTAAKLVKRQYSDYKDMSITFRNVSDKKIDGIRFRWYGETVFGDPADMGGSIQPGFGSGYTDEAIEKGKTTTLEWSMLSRNAKKNIKAWPIEVVFSDGTKWESKNATSK